MTELMTGDDEFTDACLALVRQQAVLVVMARAIETFEALEVGVEELTEALDAGVMRGLLAVDRRYWSAVRTTRTVQ